MVRASVGPQVNLAALDELATEYLASQQQQSSSGDPLLGVKQAIEAGAVDRALQLLQASAPEVLQDSRLLFKLHKLKFVQLLQTDAQAAIACARDHVAPLALDAYADAYTEFKRLMLALLLDPRGEMGSSTPRSQQEELWQREARAMMSTGARRELAEIVYHTAAQQLGRTTPTLDLLLVYLFQLHQRHPHLHLQRQHGSKSSGEGRSTDSRSDKLGGSLDIHELTRQLVLPGKDAAPLELDGGMGPSSFSEADIQALIQCAGCARREAIAALRRHNNNPSKALKSELARLRVDRALLAELIGEYATQRGLQQPPSGDSMQQDVQQGMTDGPSVLDGPADMKIDEPASGSMNLVHKHSLNGHGHSPHVSAGGGGGREGGSGFKAGSRELSREGSERRGSQAGSDHGHGSGSNVLLPPPRSASQSPPMKVARHRGDQDAATSCSSASSLGSGRGHRSSTGDHPTAAQQLFSNHSSPADGIPSKANACIEPPPQAGPASQQLPLLHAVRQLPELARKGGAAELQQAVMQLNSQLGNPLEKHPLLVFDLWRLRVAEMLAAGEAAAALSLAREQLTPLVSSHPELELEPLLKSTMSSFVLLGPGQPIPILPSLANVASACAAALQSTEAAPSTRLVSLLQALLATHASWLKAEQYGRDPFAKELRLDELVRPASSSGSGSLRAGGAGGLPSPGASQRLRRGSGGSHRSHQDRIARLVALGITGMDEAVYDDDDDDEVEDELGSEDGHLGRRAYLGSDEDDEEDDDAYMYAALHRGVGAGGGRGGGAGTAGNRADGGNELDAMLVQHMPQAAGRAGGRRARGDAAAAAVDEESILRLVEILELPRSQAIEMLVQHSGDVEAAVMAFLR